MSDHGGGGAAAGGTRRSRIADYADMTVAGTSGDPVKGIVREQARHAGKSPADGGSPPSAGDAIRGRRSEFAALLGEFRRTAVLVPLGKDEAPLAGDYGGLRWLYAFSNEAALARFAFARGEGVREWAYRRVLGARLLDAAVPAAGVPCGVALDVGSEGDGVLFPPVVGVVPDAAAVDVEPATNGEEPR